MGNKKGGAYLRQSAQNVPLIFFYGGIVARCVFASPLLTIAKEKSSNGKSKSKRECGRGSVCGLSFAARPTPIEATNRAGLARYAVGTIILRCFYTAF